ncbi:MAG: RNA polymerase factor sigma-54 [Armatimonadota bacterium]|nr:RNA polymerase factor sigma-54 [Armatimonadota bacterium]MDR5697412.1 RNA polymerase factor sigma-54 [Armatimonadota bacterium]
MEIRPGVEIAPLPQQRMVPKLMAVNAVLVLPLPQLEVRIEEELHANPALERAESACPRCGAEMRGPLCHACGHVLGEPLGEETVPSTRSADDDFDPVAHVMAEVSLQDYLLLQLGARDLKGRRRALAEFLIGSVDERGYLVADLDEAAGRFRVSRRTAEEVLALIQTFEPTGVAARSVEECLLLQLRALEPSETNGLAQRIVMEGLLPDLGRGQYAKIAQRLGTTPQAVRDVHTYIRRHLVPYPADRYEAEREGGGRLRPQEVPRPDVVIVRTPRGYAVEVAGPPAMGLRVNDVYRELYRRARRSPEEFAAHAREHIRDHVNRAKLFIETVKRRNWTLRSIVEAIVQAQREFLDRGVEHLKPLTLAMVAAQVGVSESTVSRALDGKYVQLPSGRVVSCQVFFDGSLPVKERIRHLVATEEPDAPYTDREIATRLRREGIRIARRTAAKYREEMGIPPSAARRERGEVRPRGAVAGSA